MLLIVANDFEDDLVLEFLFFGCGVSGYEAEADVLDMDMGTYPCIPTKLLGLSFSSSMFMKYIMGREEQKMSQL